MPREEQLKALAFLRHLLRADTEENRRELARRHAEMDAGQKITHDELVKRLGVS